MTDSSVTVIGAGIVGISCALELQRRGYQVRLIDRQQPAMETSSGNAGILSYSNITPIASPDLIPRLPKLIANLEADFRLDYSQAFALLPWTIKFLLRCRRSTFFADGEHMRALTNASINKHLEWIDECSVSHLLRKKSALKLYRSLKTYEDGQLERDLFDQYGVKYSLLKDRQWLDLEPDLKDIFVRAVLIDETESVVNPHKLCTAYYEQFLSLGGEFEDVEVNKIETVGIQWKLSTSKDSKVVDKLVLALGAWTPDLLKTIGYKNPIAMERGYHTIADSIDGATLSRPIFDVDASYVMSEMDMGFRISSGTNLIYRDTKPDFNQINRVLPRVREAFPIGDIKTDTPWMGRRPTPPDSLPLIGAAPRHKNLWVAFGHSHMGLTMGPMTGVLMADILQNNPSIIDQTPYSPDRYL